MKPPTPQPAAMSANPSVKTCASRLSVSEWSPSQAIAGITPVNTAGTVPGVVCISKRRVRSLGSKRQKGVYRQNGIPRLGKWATLGYRSSDRQRLPIW